MAGEADCASGEAANRLAGCGPRRVGSQPRRRSFQLTVLVLTPSRILPGRRILSVQRTDSMLSQTCSCLLAYFVCVQNRPSVRHRGIQIRRFVYRTRNRQNSMSVSHILRQKRKNGPEKGTVSEKNFCNLRSVLLRRCCLSAFATAILRATPRTTLPFM